MKPLDPRLLRYASSARGPVAAVALLGALQAGLIIAQAFVITAVIVRPVRDGLHLRGLSHALVALVLVVGARGAACWLSDVLARRAAIAVTEQLRTRVLSHALALGPGWLSGVRRGELTALLTRGITALEPYVGRYLPTLVLAGVVPPLAIVVIATEDPLSAIIIIATLPLVPLFAALVGWATERTMMRQWRSMTVLAGHFADVVAGLPTLVAHRRARAQSATIAEVTRRHRTASMATLRLAFASSAVLEMVATTSVALIAVSIGLRVINSSLGFGTGLVVLLLAPEAYWPLRRVGAEFHAAAEGLAAMEQVATILQTEMPARGTRRDVPDLRTATVAVTGLVVTYPDRTFPALGPLTATWRSGGLPAIAGDSGCGKSTLFAALLGFAPITRGTISLDGLPLAEFDPEAVRAQIAWIPQQPYLMAGTVADTVRLLRPTATDDEVASALAEVGLIDTVAHLPNGVDTVLGGDDVGLSAGERSRLALARALIADRGLVLLDEPTARLDGLSEALILAAVQRLRKRCTVLMVAHREPMVAAADTVTRLTIPALPAADTALATSHTSAAESSRGQLVIP
jgi:ATP-binding cassette subfamily C protein CydCD